MPSSSNDRGTKTKTGLNVRCELDPNTYPAGIKVTDDDLAPSTLSVMPSRRMELHIHPKPSPVALSRTGS